MSGSSRRHVVLGILLVGSVLFLLHGMRGAPPRQGREQEQARAEPAAPVVAPELRPAAPADVTFDRYARLSKTNVFSERRSEPPPRSASPPVVPPPPFQKDKQNKQSAASTKPDFVGWSYVGYVRIGDEQLGILQNDATHSCKQFAVGDSFQGAVVEEISRDSLRFAGGTALRRVRDFPVTPLEKPTRGPEAPQRQR